MINRTRGREYSQKAKLTRAWEGINSRGKCIKNNVNKINNRKSKLENVCIRNTEKLKKDKTGKLKNNNNAYKLKIEKRSNT